MYSTDDLEYQALPLPDRVQLEPPASLAKVQAFRDYMKQRHSVRQYARRPVAEEVIAACIEAAGTAPSGANHQPWHFVAISDPVVKARIRAAAEAEESAFYAGGAGDEWLRALEPIGTGVSKPHLEDAPWLIVVFAQRWGVTREGTRYKNYYVPESVGIATGLLIAAIHHAGLVCLEHTPNPMIFLRELCGRPAHEKAVMILPERKFTWAMVPSSWVAMRMELPRKAMSVICLPGSVFMRETSSPSLRRVTAMVPSPDAVMAVLPSAETRIGEMMSAWMAACQRSVNVSASTRASVPSSPPMTRLPSFVSLTAVTLKPG